MMQIVPKWKITVKFSEHEVQVWMNDHSVSNVIRQIASMEFTSNSLEQPQEIVIAACKPPMANLSVASGGQLTGVSVATSYT